MRLGIDVNRHKVRLATFNPNQMQSSFFNFCFCDFFSGDHSEGDISSSFSFTEAFQAESCLSGEVEDFLRMSKSLDDISFPKIVFESLRHASDGLG